mmetsp:Transcript_11942/g.31402  ORF Transcript_11942/g.31402 Transcript_11942/m.31402 type:complete len:249 (+) Transcript_11942:69-815(+)
MQGHHALYCAAPAHATGRLRTAGSGARGRRHLLAALLMACGHAKTAVLVHGFHLRAPNWETVVWGGGGGRVAYGYDLAKAEAADLFVVGSGASTDEETGETEGAVILRRLREGNSRASSDALISDAVVLDDALNTREELERFSELCRARGVERAFCVSSPAHCPRVCRDAAVAFGARHPTCRWAVAPCRTDFSRASDVAVVEPPHRPDREQPLLHDVVNRVFRLPPADQAAFVDHAVAFLDGAEGYPP